MGKKIKKLKIKNEKGLTLMEVLVAIFIFNIMMVAVVQIFGNSASSYRNAVKIQRNLEDAQYSINQIMKTLRTSTIVDKSGLEVTVFDYSRATDACIKYKFASHKIMVGYEDHADLADCTSSVSADKEMTSGRIENMNFDITESEDQTGNPVVGKATISAKVCTESSGSCSATGTVQIQSSVSLRDYDVSFQQ